MKYSGIVRSLILAFLITGTLAFAQETEIPDSLRNNKYYLESLRFANLAKLAYEEGDYDASINYSEEAIRNAHLSDDYVLFRLRMFEADKAILAAANRLSYVSSIGAAARYPAEYGEAQAAYTQARSFRAAAEWDDAIEAANRVLEILAFIDGGTRVAGGGTGVLPAQYTVRTWQNVKDCLWNIAAQPWAYNDPWKWKVLYDANKSKLPQTNNPDLIRPGMVLDIPSIKGETRQGMWSSGSSYTPFK